MVGLELWFDQLWWWLFPLWAQPRLMHLIGAFILQLLCTRNYNIFVDMGASYTSMWPVI